MVVCRRSWFGMIPSKVIVIILDQFTSQLIDRLSKDHHKVCAPIADRNRQGLRDLDRAAIRIYYAIIPLYAVPSNGNLPGDMVLCALVLSPAFLIADLLQIVQQ